MSRQLSVGATMRRILKGAYGLPVGRHCCLSANHLCRPRSPDLGSPHRHNNRAYSHLGIGISHEIPPDSGPMDDAGRSPRSCHNLARAASRCPTCGNLGLRYLEGLFLLWFLSSISMAGKYWQATPRSLCDRYGGKAPWSHSLTRSIVC